MTEAAAAPAAEIPSHVTVVTPDNFEEYVNERVPAREVLATDIIDANKGDADAPTDVKTKDAGGEEITATNETPAEKVEADKKKHGINERFSEVTQARKDAEAKAKASDERAAKAEAEAAELRAKLNPPAPVAQDADPKPQAKDFQDAFEYAEKLSMWAVRDAKRQDAQQAAEARAKTDAEQTVKTWQDRQAAAKAAIPDYEETIAKSANLVVSNEIRDAILDSEVGPHLLHYLAANPAEVERIGKLKVGAALRELGKMEAKFGSADKPSTKSAEAPLAEVSNAPAPITPLRGEGVPVTNKVVNGEFKGTFEEFKRLRKAGKIG